MPASPLRSPAGARDVELQPVAERPRNGWARFWAMPWCDFWICFLWFLICVFVMCYAMNYVDARMPSPEHNEVLPDIIQGIWSVPQNSTTGQWLQVASDVMFFSNALTCAGVAIWNYKFRCLPIFVKLFAVMGATYLIRVPFMLSTSLPPTADVKCRYTMPRAVIPNYLTNALLGLVTLGNGNVHCGDLFFSGHTIVLCCCWMGAMQHLRHIPAAVVFCSICVFGNMLILIVRNNHYTMDVLTSFYVTCSLWVFHPLRRPVYLDLKWYLSWGERCSTCWVSEPLPDDESSFLLPEILDCDFGPPEAPVASASAVLGKGGSHRDPEGFEHTL